jgi:uncharacterized protein (UPF0218 family)
MIRKDLVLPDKFRAELGAGRYALCRSRRSIMKVIGRSTEIYAVGDVTVNTLLSYGYMPKLSIFDNSTARARADFPLIKDRFPKPYKISNPPGRITKGLFNLIERSIRDRCGIAIEVKGEEDLAAMPCIIFARNGSLVAYGLRGKGMSIIKVDARIKARVTHMLREMGMPGKRRIARSLSSKRA